MTPAGVGHDSTGHAADQDKNAARKSIIQHSRIVANSHFSMCRVGFATLLLQPVELATFGQRQTGRGKK